MPDSDDAGLAAKVNELRSAGEVVINSLGGQVDKRCDRQLVEAETGWVVESIQ